MKTVEECIAGFLEQVEKRKHVDYANRSSVRKYNVAYDKCFRYAEYIDKHYPNCIGALIALLDHSDLDVVAHCAPMILRLRNSTIDQRKQAIAAVYKMIEDPRLDSISKLGFSASVIDWEKKLSDEIAQAEGNCSES